VLVEEDGFQEVVNHGASEFLVTVAVDSSTVVTGMVSRYSSDGIGRFSIGSNPGVKESKRQDGLRIELFKYRVDPDYRLLLVAGPGPWNVNTVNLSVAVDWNVEVHSLNQSKHVDLLSSYGMAKNKPPSMLQPCLNALHQFKSGRNPIEHRRQLIRYQNQIHFLIHVLERISLVSIRGRGLKDWSMVASVLYDKSRQLKIFISSDVSDSRLSHNRVSFVVDWCLGIIGAFLLGLYREDVDYCAYEYLGYAFRSESIEVVIKWILSHHAPLGFKLNSQLDSLFGSMFLLVSHWWYLITSYIAPYAQWLLVVAGGIAVLGGGLSIVVAAACDTVAFVSLHVRLLLAQFSVVYRLQLGGIVALLKLVVGKKQNVLRKRIDTLETDTAQFYLGSTLLIALVFLFQTTFAYYVLVCSLWFIVWLIYTVCWWVVMILRSFPFYSAVLLMKDRKYFPSRIHVVPNQLIPNMLVVHGSYLTKRHLLDAWLRICFATWNRKFPNSWAPVLWGNQVPLPSNLY